MIRLDESEIKNILKRHKIISETVEIEDIITDATPKDTRNFKSFVEFLNGNIELDDIVNRIVKIEKTIPDDSEETTDIKVGSRTTSDDQIYKEILSGIGADDTEENMKFFYAWRQAEGAQAAFNPFNTTQKKDGSTFYNCLKKEGGKCKAGVRNYKSDDDGIDATIKTLKNGHYPCIVDGLKNNIGARKIAQKCSQDLKTWGTGGLITKVLKGSRLDPPAISRRTAKKVS